MLSSRDIRITFLTIIPFLAAGACVGSDETVSAPDGEPRPPDGKADTGATFAITDQPLASAIFDAMQVERNYGLDDGSIEKHAGGVLRCESRSSGFPVEGGPVPVISHDCTLGDLFRVSGDPAAALYDALGADAGMGGGGYTRSRERSGVLSCTAVFPAFAMTTAPQYTCAFVGDADEPTDSIGPGAARAIYDAMPEVGTRFSDHGDRAERILAGTLRCAQHVSGFPFADAPPPVASYDCHLGSGVFDIDGIGAEALYGALPAASASSDGAYTVVRAALGNLVCTAQVDREPTGSVTHACYFQIG
jgi:hypothetical protein